MSVFDSLPPWPEKYQLPAANGHDKEHISNRDAEAPAEKLAAALAVIPNPPGRADWDWWCYVGMGLNRATGGSADGFNLFDGWSQKCDGVYDLDACIERWEHWNSSSPPTRIGAGTIFYLADQAQKLNGSANWRETLLPRAIDEFGEIHENCRPRRLRWAPMALWDTQPRPIREWAVADRVPRRQVGLFSGEGGTGKSLIELVKNAAHALGREWFGAQCTQGPAFYLGCEDEEDEINIRLGYVADYFGVNFTELDRAGLRVMSLLGEDAVLCAVNPRSGKVERTRFYHELLEEAGDLKPINISVDTLSRAFAGNEIDRVQVYAFAMYMQALAKAANGSVTVLSHPSLSGIANGSGLSGSTAWHGAFRFRQYLRNASKEEDRDEGIRELIFKKNQYGPIGEKLALRFQGGLFLPQPRLSDMDAAAAAELVDAEFLDLIRTFDAQGRPVSHKPRSNNYAPRLFAAAGGCSKNDYEQSMERLFKDGRIKVKEYGKQAWGWQRIVIV